MPPIIVERPYRVIELTAGDILSAPWGSYWHQRFTQHLRSYSADVALKSLAGWRWVDTSGPVESTKGIFDSEEEADLSAWSCMCTDGKAYNAREHIPAPGSGPVLQTVFLAGGLTHQSVVDSLDSCFAHRFCLWRWLPRVPPKPVHRDAQ